MQRKRNCDSLLINVMYYNVEMYFSFVGQTIYWSFSAEHAYVRKIQKGSGIVVSKLCQINDLKHRTWILKMRSYGLKLSWKLHNFSTSSLEWQSQCQQPWFLHFWVRGSIIGSCHLPSVGDKKRDRFLSSSICWQEEGRPLRPVLVAFHSLAIRREIDSSRLPFVGNNKRDRFLSPSIHWR